MSEIKQACTQRRYEVTKKDLPISCPMPGYAGMECSSASVS